MIDFDEHAVLIAPRAARAPRKLERAALIEAKKAISAKKRCFSSSAKEPLMTRFLRAASVGEIDAFLRISNPDDRSACMNRIAARGDVRGLWKLLCAKGIAEETLRERNAMNRFLRLPEAKEADLLSSERPPVSADQLLWSARAVVIGEILKNYPPQRSMKENERLLREVDRALKNIGI